jgi:hypothetical protein
MPLWAETLAHIGSYPNKTHIVAFASDAALGGNARPRRLPYADSGSGSFLG